MMRVKTYFGFLLLLGLSPMPVFAEEVQGFLEPWSKVDAAAAEPGIITAIHVKEGDRVEAGQLLVEQDVRVLEASLAIAKARAESKGAYESARSILRMREKRFAKLQALKKSGHARDEELETSRSELAIARANLLTAREEQLIHQLEVERINAQIERRRLRSPFEGVVTRILKEEAEVSGGTNDQIITLAQLDPLKLVLHVSAPLALKMKVKDEVPLRVAGSGEKLTGVVDTVSPVIDADSGTVRVTISLDNKKNLVRSGMRVYASLSK